MSGKEYYSLLKTSGGLALEYQDIIESDFSSANGSPYSPPEEGTFRRIDVSRSIQLLADCPGIIETFQTSSAEIRLPCSTISVSTDDAGNGRLFWVKNSGVGLIVIKDYLGTSLFTMYQGIHVIVTGNRNNTWDFYFTASNVFFDPTGTSFTSTDVRGAILEIVTNPSVSNSASPGFTWGKSGSCPAGTYLLNDATPSNTTGRIIPISSGYIKEVFVAVENAGNFTFSIQRRSGISFTEISSVSLVSARSGVFSVSVAVSLGDELAIQVSPTTSESPRNPVIGLIIRGAI